MRFFFPICVSSLLVLMSCGADPDSRLGAVGEECLADSDCQEPFVCDEQICGAAGSADGSNANISNGTSNGTSNDTSVRSPSCSEICVLIAECLGDSAGGESCVSDCEIETANWSDAEYNEFTTCLETSNCSEIDTCVPSSDTSIED